MVSISAPELQIVSDKLWQQVHERLDQQRTAYLRGTNGQLWGRPARGVESKYLLPGLARCGSCGGSMYVKSRSHGKKRAFFYGCTSFHLRGSAVCSNSLEVPMPASDLAVLSAIEADILRPEIITKALRKAVDRLKPMGAAAQAKRGELEKRLLAVNRELERLTSAIVAGGSGATLVQAMKEREEHRDILMRELATADQVSKIGQVQWAAVERQLQEKLKDWKGLLQRHAPQARQMLKKLLCGPIVFTPHREGKSRHYTFRAQLNLDRLLSGTVCANMVASPTGFEPVFWP